MPLNILLVCDQCKAEALPGGVITHKLQPLYFDSLEETFGDMVSAIRGYGWRVDIGEKARVLKTLCPDHNHGLK